MRKALAIIGSVAWLASNAANAQQYPAKPIRVVVAVRAGRHD